MDGCFLEYDATSCLSVIHPEGDGQHPTQLRSYETQRRVPEVGRLTG